MNVTLSPQETRVLGSLIEKEKATPDYYPLTLNALVNACNQKTNRDPVVSFDEATVSNALYSLQEKKLVRKSNVSRVEKYEQIFSESINLINREEAVICVLLLRGPQTIGEIRGRTERLYSFTDLDEVQKTLTNLDDMGFIKKLPRQPGQKESRYTQLLSEHTASSSDGGNSDEAVANVVDDTAITQSSFLELQQQIVNMQKEINQLQIDFAEFKAQFE